MVSMGIIFDEYLCLMGTYRVNGMCSLWDIYRMFVNTAMRPTTSFEAL